MTQKDALFRRAYRLYHCKLKGREAATPVEAHNVGLEHGR